ncbi:Gfo/Idh/MocA family oxidoreductase [Arthrobacter sp. D1-29]
MTLKVGILGFGERSSIAHYAHKPDEGSEVAAVFDPSEAARDRAQADYPDARVTGSLREFLALGLDAVMITSPDHTHAALALETLRAGITTFCEKPLAITLEDCDQVLEEAFRTGTRLYIGHNMRHMPVIVQMRQLIDEGRIGDVKAIWCRHFIGNGGDFYFKDWHADRSKSGGMLLQKGAHDIDVIHWLAKGYSRRVAAVGSLSVYGEIADRRDRSAERRSDWFSLDNWPPKAQTGLNPVVDVEDISMMNMILDNGVLGAYMQCHFTPDYWRNYTVIGTEGRLENMGDGPGSEIHLWNRRREGHAPPDEIYAVGGDDQGHGGADPVMVAEFLKFAADGVPTATSPIAARNAVAAGLLATESLRGNGCALDVPMVDESLAYYFESGQKQQQPAPVRIPQPGPSPVSTSIHYQEKK